MVVERPALVVPLKVTTFAAISIAETVAIPDALILVATRVSPVLIPTTESNLAVLTPD